MSHTEQAQTPSTYLEHDQKVGRKGFINEAFSKKSHLKMTVSSEYFSLNFAQYFLNSALFSSAYMIIIFSLS